MAWSGMGWSFDYEVMHLCVMNNAVYWPLLSQLRACNGAIEVAVKMVYGFDNDYTHTLRDEKHLP
jgi:hypothetical protein